MSSPKDVYYGYRETILNKETELKKLLKEKNIKIESHYQALKLCLIKDNFVLFLLKTCNII